MSSRLVTQLVEDSPKILLISSENSLKRRTELFLSRQGLEVEALPSLFKQEYLHKLQSRDFYKIIVIGSGEDLKENLSKLRQYKNVLVINLVSSFVPDQYISQHSHLIIGQDIIQHDEKVDLFEFIKSKANSGLLLDPGLKVYLQSEERFFTLAKNHILSPQKQRILIKGKEHSTQSVVNEMLRLLSLFRPGEEFIVKQDFQKGLSHPFSGFEEVNGEIEAIPSLIEEIVRNIQVKKHTSLDEKKDFHQRVLQEPMPEKSVPVKPTPIPNKESRTSNELKIEDNNEAIPQYSSQETKRQSREVVKDAPKKEDVSVDEKLNQIFKVKRVEEKVEKVKHKVTQTKKIKKSTKKKKSLFIVGIIFTFIASGMLAMAGFFWFSSLSLEKELTRVFIDFSTSEEEISYELVKQKADLVDKQINLYEQIVPPEFFIDSRNLIEISLKLVEYDNLSKEFEQDTSNIVAAILGKDIIEDVLSSQKPAKTAQAYYETATRLLSRLNDLKETVKEKDSKERIAEFISYVETQKKNLQTYQQLSPILDDMFGLNGKKTYGVIFQNNQELRPTGGFIQAVAFITVDQGMIVDSQVFSSYELDKNLGGAVVPPDDIIRLLGENKWYLRDSNWNPDFPASAKQISWFLEQESNRKVDGVIGINLFVLQNILKEIGPLDLEEYNEIITDKNIFERSEFHSEIKLVDSDDIEDYQANLLKYLLRDVITKGRDNSFGLLSALSKSLSEKQMIIYSSDEDIMRTFSALGWSGELITPECPTQLSVLPCHVDSLVINEANIGVNKSNYHTYREDQHVIEIKNNEVLHSRTITLENTAFSNAWPKGRYRAYFRMYLPQNITSLSINIDGIVVDESKYEIIEKNGYNIVGILVETPIKTEKAVRIDYVLPIEFSAPYSYVFFNQKQPGTDGVLPQIVVKHDSALSPTLIAPQAQVDDDTIIFNSLPEDHTFVGISFE